MRLAAVMYVSSTVLMARYEVVMRRRGGGINSLVFAGNAKRTQEVIDGWGTTGVNAARTSLHIDFGYIVCYSAFATLLAERARRQLERRGAPLLHRAPVILCTTAAAADVFEGIASLKLLRGTATVSTPRWTRRSALVKFTSLFGVVIYCSWAQIKATLKPKSQESASYTRIVNAYVQ